MPDDLAGIKTVPSYHAAIHGPRRTPEEYVRDRLRDRTLSASGAIEWLVNSVGRPEEIAQAWVESCEREMRDGL